MGVCDIPRTIIWQRIGMVTSHTLTRKLQPTLARISPLWDELLERQNDESFYGKV